MSPAEVIEEVKASGLRGRGGAGFPTGQKWAFVPQDTGKPTYMVVNFDESEPGTFNNRELIERDPHQFLEGAIIGAFAIQSHTVFIYTRGEFLYPGTVLQRAVAEAYDAGFLGADVAGSGYAIDVVIHRGAGAYICGEETALLESLEGRRGQPRLRPPFPVVAGVYASPDGDQQRRDAVERPAHRRPRLGLVRRHRDREVDRHQDVLAVRQGEPPGELRGADGHARPGADRGVRRRRSGRAGGEGVDAGRFVDAASHRRPPRHGDGLRVGAAAGSLLGTERDDRDGRPRLRGRRDAPDTRVLRPRILRQVHAVPRGHLVDDQGPAPDRSTATAAWRTCR